MFTANAAVLLDKGHHDRLMSAAVQFNERFASKYSDPSAGAWTRVQLSLTGKVAAKQAYDKTHRVFVFKLPYTT